MTSKRRLASTWRAHKPVSMNARKVATFTPWTICGTVPGWKPAPGCSISWPGRVRFIESEFSRSNCLHSDDALYDALYDACTAVESVSQKLRARYWYQRFRRRNRQYAGFFRATGAGKEDEMSFSFTFAVDYDDEEHEEAADAKAWRKVKDSGKRMRSRLAKMPRKKSLSILAGMKTTNSPACEHRAVSRGNRGSPSRAETLPMTPTVQPGTTGKARRGTGRNQP